IVCGTSIGSLVGAAYVAGRLGDLRQWAEAVTWREIVGLMDIRLSGGGLIDGKDVVAFLDKLGITGIIEALPKPFAAVATDLFTGREIWLQSGSVLDAVRASIAIPGIFTPAWLDGKWLLDGGLANPVPVSVTRALGADIIIAVNLNSDLVGRHTVEASKTTEADTGSTGAFLGRLLEQVPAAARVQAAQIASWLSPEPASGPPAPGYFDVLATSINIMQDHITRTRLAGEPPHVMLVPRLRDIGLMDYDRAAEAIAEGRASVAQAMPALERYLSQAV
ncbi:MAG TPA: patatin-like phospholipase family protein, partial [Kaistiaceae bacterium]|nr:patatin-like phospholipase family protein [Kaistiaceae bacterium]